MKIKRIEIGVPPGVRARSHIVIIYTGGTFGMHYDARGVLIPFDFGGIRSHLPVIGKLGLDLTIFSFETPIDSSSVSPAHWKEMVRIISANYHVADGFVLLHGTDTMAYTASALSFMLGGLSKPVVLTGAQLPIAELRSDGRENLIAALEVASARWRGQAAVPEVCIYFNYQLLRGNRARKVQSMQFDAFDSGNYPLLARAGVKIDYNRTVIRKPGARLQVRTAFDRNVSLLKL